MFKKITSLILAILLVLSFAGCSTDTNGPTPASEATQDTEAANATEAIGETEVTETTDEHEATQATPAATKVTDTKATKTTKTTKATTATKSTRPSKSTKSTKATKATASTKVTNATVSTKATTAVATKPTVGANVTKQTQSAAIATTASKSSATTKTTQAATKATTAATAATKATATESTSAQIETDEKLFSVEITLPASMFESEDMSKFDADAYADEQGFTSAKVNKDGSVTITMTKAKHKELLDEMSTSLDKNFQEFVNGEDTPYIKEISHNDNFTAVTMKVDKAAYENAFDFTPFAIAVSVSMYQAFTETEYHVEITIVDVATGATIDSITYPDALNG